MVSVNGGTARQLCGEGEAGYRVAGIFNTEDEQGPLRATGKFG